MCRGYSTPWEWFLWAVVLAFKPFRWVGKRMFPEWEHWLVVLLILPLLCGPITGCATAWQAAQNPIVQTVVQRGIEYGVIKFLSSKPRQQPVALEVVNYLQDYADQSAQVTVKDLEGLAMDKIPWFKMSVERQYALRGMIEDISAYLQDRVGEGVLSDDDRVELGEFLKWMKQAIIFAGR